MQRTDPEDLAPETSVAPSKAFRLTSMTSALTSEPFRLTSDPRRCPNT